jgi:hypothetical protein
MVVSAASVGMPGKLVRVVLVAVGVGETVLTVASPEPAVSLLRLSVVVVAVAATFDLRSTL